MSFVDLVKQHEAKFAVTDAADEHVNQYLRSRWEQILVCAHAIDEVLDDVVTNRSNGVLKRRCDEIAADNKLRKSLVVHALAKIRQINGVRVYDRAPYGANAVKFGS